jgi:superoxide dismutase, Fe-Mn family
MKNIRTNKLKLIGAIFVVGLLSLQFITIAHETPKDQIIKNQTSNNPKNYKTMNTSIAVEFKALPYAYDALEPYIDKQTVEIHYSKHHKAYYDNFMNAIKGSEMESMNIKEIFKNMSKYPMAVRNNGGGYFNHTFYWESMKAHGGGQPTGKLSEAIVKTFNSFEEFKTQFSDAAKTRFGSG